LLKIIALDPGGTTGWASYTDFTDERLAKFACGQIGPDEHHEELFSDVLLAGTGYEVEIVCESFEYRNANRPGLVLLSKEYIGVAKLSATMFSRPYTEQTASKAKGFVRDSHIKKLGLWSVGNKHAMDAMRHLIYYMINGPHRNSEVARKLLEVGYK
jgi:hypothetical protein